MSKLDLEPRWAALDPNAASTEPVRLNTQWQWNDALQRLRSHIIQSDERGLPRYGVLSILARRVPFHLYDHPAIARLCNTAFTDGIHVFVHTPFLSEVLDADQRSANPQQSMILVLLHELSHILFRHHTRLPAHAPPLLWSIACDIAINTRLAEAYPALQPGSVFDDAWGASQEDRDAYAGQSEEHILNGLWEAPTPQNQDFVKRLKDALQSGNPPNEALDKRGTPLDAHAHMISPEDLSKTLDEHGLQHVREILTLPDPDDRPAFQNLQSMRNLFLAGDFDKAREIRDLHPAGRTMAGDHLEDAYAEWVDNELYGLVEWKNLLHDLVLGEGVRYEQCDELPSDIYFVEPTQMQLDAPLYIGSLTPAAPDGVAVCVIDTSGSISIDLLRVFIGELNNLLEHECVSDNKIYVVTADTAVRADAASFAEHVLGGTPDQLPMHGRGGTDITRVLNEVLQWTQSQQEFAPHELHALIYFTDLLDRPPTREELPAEIPRLLFLSPPASTVRTFRDRVAEFAMVAEIRDGTIIDL
ncbi:MAG: VWA-like domain-containing protein [Pseudomonadota bacterium]